MIQSHWISFFDELLEWLLLNDDFLDCRLCSEEGFVDLVCRDLILKGMVQDVLGRRIFLDGLDMSRDRNI